MENVQHVDRLLVEAVDGDMSMSMTASPNEDVTKVGTCSYRFASGVISTKASYVLLKEGDVALSMFAPVC